jgi:predicted MFS family arabinose efflux permease
VVGAAVFTPQAAATAGLLVPAEQRASAIAFIFIGWSAASVAGIPLGSYISSLIGWRLVFAGMGVVSAIAALLLWKSLRPGLFVQPLNAAAWKEALSHPVILAVLAVTLISMSGQMTVFTYIAPILRDGFSGGPEEVSLAFAVAGIAGVCGNWLASRLVARLGIDQAIAMAILSLIIGIGLFAASFGVLLYALIGIGLWGLGSFSSNSLQQSRLVAIAPGLAAATVALNTSVVYVGQAVGAGLGGWFMQGAVAPSIIWTACALTALSLLMSFTATWLRKRV